MINVRYICAQVKYLLCRIYCIWSSTQTTNLRIKKYFENTIDILFWSNQFYTSGIFFNRYYISSVHNHWQLDQEVSYLFKNVHIWVNHNDRWFSVYLPKIITRNINFTMQKIKRKKRFVIKQNRFLKMSNNCIYSPFH